LNEPQKCNLESLICDILGFLENTEAHKIGDLFHSPTISCDVQHIKECYQDHTLRLESYDIHTLAGALKAYLIDGGQFITNDFCNKCIRAIDNNVNSIEDQLHELKLVFSWLSAASKSIFSKLLPFLEKIANTSENRRITLTCLSIVFAPIFLRANTLDPLCMLRRSTTCAKIMELIISNQALICNEMSKL